MIAPEAQVHVQKIRRIQSIDVLRGAVMIIMALDHVRGDFHMSKLDPTDLYSTTPVVFLTRWITHFCAPAFLLLSGISAYLAGLKKTKAELSRFLISRGLWLVLLEVVLITFIHKLDFFYHEIFLQVIWAIGVSMVILGLLIWAPVLVIAIIGTVLFLGHDLFDNANIDRVSFCGILLNVLFGNPFSIHVAGLHFVFFFYAVLPCTAIMLSGYFLGNLYESGFGQQKRQKILIVSGVCISLIFVVLRAINGYGDPSAWMEQKNNIYTVLSFLNTTKYPLSLDFMCMALGPVLVILALIEHKNNWLTNKLAVFGKVAFFYYVLHLAMIRFFQIIAIAIFEDKIPGIVKRSSGRLISVRFHILWIYLIWLVLIFTLYFPCKWFAAYKRSHTHWWLSYL
jgi:uncharacterized membrane protein